jgi:hypothetical protein
MAFTSLETPGWSTAAFGDDAQTSPGELSALGSHMHQCKGASGRFFAARCVADSMHGFAAPRLVTTLVLVLLLLAAGALML